jgi:Mn2+/Fe2+ NRAMP family transporter
VLHGTLVPTIRWDSDYLSLLVAILGTTISPYLFFWQSDHEIEEEKSKTVKKGQRAKPKHVALKHAAWDVNAGMLLSNAVMYFIIFAAAATLHDSGKHEIESAAEAAQALRPVAGNAAFVLMALGLIGTGVLAVPILTASAAFGVAEAMGWRCGLDEKPHRAKEFYLVMAVCTIAALAINLLNVDPMKALFVTAVINGFLAPPLLVGIMILSNSHKVMGKERNGIVLQVLGWTTTVLMSVAAAVLIWTWSQGS